MHDMLQVVLKGRKVAVLGGAAGEHGEREEREGDRVRRDVDKLAEAFVGVQVAGRRVVARRELGEVLLRQFLRFGLQSSCASMTSVSGLLR